MLGGCALGKPDQPQGHRYEYSRDELVQNEHGEWVYRQVPTVVPVWKTRPGPETGPYRHEPLTENYTGYQAKDVVKLRQEMGMQPGENQWPTGAYISQEEYDKKHPPQAQTVPKRKRRGEKINREGFPKYGKNRWMDSNYGNSKTQSMY